MLKYVTAVYIVNDKTLNLYRIIKYKQFKLDTKWVSLCLYQSVNTSGGDVRLSVRDTRMGTGCDPKLWKGNRKQTDKELCFFILVRTTLLKYDLLNVFQMSQVKFNKNIKYKNKCINVKLDTKVLAMWIQSLNCEHLCVSSNYLTERRTSDNGSRHMASPRCESEYEVWLCWL